MNRIICIGNRFHPQDSSGPKVYDILKSSTLPADTELIDGGLGGINLLTLFEHVDRIVFVDAVTGFTAEESIVVLEDPVKHIHINTDFGHSAGLGYLLRVAPLVIETPMPEVILLGVNGQPDNRLCRQAAKTCLSLLQHNLCELTITPVLCKH